MEGGALRHRARGARPSRRFRQKWSGENGFVAGTVNFEKSTTDFGQTFLGQRQVLMQAVFEDVADGSEIEIVTEAAGKPLCFVGIIRLRRAGDAMKSSIKRLDAETDGAGKFGMGD